MLGCVSGSSYRPGPVAADRVQAREMLPGAACELLGAPRVGGTWEFRGNTFFVCRAVKPHVDWLTFDVPPFCEESAQSQFQPIVNMYCTNWKMEAQRGGGLLHPGGGLVCLLLDPWPCVCKQIHHMYTPPPHSSPSPSFPPSLSLSFPMSLLSKGEIPLHTHDYHCLVICSPPLIIVSGTASWVSEYISIKVPPAPPTL